MSHHYWTRSSQWPKIRPDSPTSWLKPPSYLNWSGGHRLTYLGLAWISNSKACFIFHFKWPNFRNFEISKFHFDILQGGKRLDYENQDTVYIYSSKIPLSLSIQIDLCKPYTSYSPTNPFCRPSIKSLPRVLFMIKTLLLCGVVYSTDWSGVTGIRNYLSRRSGIIHYSDMGLAQIHPTFSVVFVCNMWDIWVPVW